MSDFAQRLAAKIWDSHIRFGGQTALHEGARVIERAGGREVWIESTARLIRDELLQELQSLDHRSAR